MSSWATHNRELMVRVYASKDKRQVKKTFTVMRKGTSCFKIEVHVYSFVLRMKIQNEVVQRKCWLENSFLLFPVVFKREVKAP